VTTNPEIRRDAARYRPLGLIANPFVAPVQDGASVGAALEVAAASNRLLAAIAAAASADEPKPIVVTKSNEVPSSYPLRAIGNVEAALINDDSLNVVHAYIQLYMMRKGRVRSTLGIVGERVAFRSFDETLARYIANVIDEPDDQLASYHVLGPDRLSEFADAFNADPVAVTTEYFGTPEIERRPELAKVADIRLTSLDADAEESETSLEIDATVGHAPGTGVGLPAADELELRRQAVVDYLIEYTATHLSKVVARGLRIYRERGLAAMATEWKITKAPRKTLAAISALASVRFDKLAVIYDGFESWMQIEPELRHTIVLTIAEMRWLLSGTAVFVLLLEEGGVPEVEEQFAAGTHIKWDFPALVPLQAAPDELDGGIIDAWIEAATISGSPLTMADSTLSALSQDANSSLGAFVTMASAAVENAAGRGIGILDDEALAAGRQALADETDN